MVTGIKRFRQHLALLEENGYTTVTVSQVEPRMRGQTGKLENCDWDSRNQFRIILVLLHITD